MAACRSARCRSRACCSRTRPPTASLDRRAARDRALARRRCRRPSFYVVGGGWRALARVRLAMTDTPLKVVHDYRLSADEAMTLGRTSPDWTMRNCRRCPGMPGRRIETVRAAALLLERVVRRLEPDRVVFSAFGLREGRVFARLPDRRAGPGPAARGSPGFRSSRSRLPEIGAAMGEWTAPSSAGETSQQRRLRLAVCEVSDSAWREHPAFRAREAFYRLAQYPFIGLDHAGAGLSRLCRVHPLRGQPRRSVHPAAPLAAAGAPSGAGPSCWAPRCSWATGSRPRCPTFCRPAGCGLPGDELRLHLPAPDAAPDPEILRPRLRAVAKALGLTRTKVLTAA